MTREAPVFETIRRDYLQKVAALGQDRQLAERLGIHLGDGGFRIPFFNRRYTVMPSSIEDQRGRAPNHAVAVTLCQYLLLCPRTPTNDPTLVTYKDFRDAAPYAGGFFTNAELPIARGFTGKAASLESACLDLGGERFQIEAAYQLAFRFQALPRLPIYLLFNDADDTFPAGCTLLFQKDAADYLDMECIAMVGSILAAWLQAS